MALEKMQNHFSGLPMHELIGGPLDAACKAQLKLAQATADFIANVGFYDDNGVSKTRYADFSFAKNIVTGKDELGHDIIDKEDVKMSVPMLAIVNIPSLMVDEVDITFDMEVKSSESHTDSLAAEASMSAQAQVGWGPISASVSISGSVSTHQENVRKSDNSAKYHVSVHAADTGTPEGLSRVLDIMASVVAPEEVEGPQKRKDKKQMKQLEPLSRKKARLLKDLSGKKLEIEHKTEELEVLKKQEGAQSKEATEIEERIDKLQDLDASLSDELEIK